MNDHQIKLATQKTLSEAIDARMSIESLLALQALPNAERSKAALQLSNLLLAHRKMTTIKIDEIRQELRSNESELTLGIDKMKAAIAELDTIKKMISATTDFLKIVGRLVPLL